MDTGARGRKTHNFYSKLCFVNKKLANGRTAAQCTVCNVVLKNTAVARLRTHRKICHPADSPQSGSEGELEEPAFGCNEFKKETTAKIGTSALEGNCDVKLTQHSEFVFAVEECGRPVENTAQTDENELIVIAVDEDKKPQIGRKIRPNVAKMSTKMPAQKCNVYLKKKMSAKENYYKRKLELLERKLGLIQKSVDAQERIATALENLCS